MPSNKYKAKSVYYNLDWQREMTQTEIEFLRKNSSKKFRQNNILFFASTFEFRVYESLISLFGAEAIVCQHPIQIFPPTRCCPKGKKWTVDFMVRPDEERKRPFMLIEAKGMVTDAFLNNLIMLEVASPLIFDSLYVLFDRTVPHCRTIDNLLKSNGASKPSHPRNRFLLLSKFLEKQYKLQPVQ